MTGNKNAWRAPLAGLASVAMIATMGVAASTASAADANKVTVETTAAGKDYGIALYDKTTGSVLESDEAATVANGENLGKNYAVVDTVNDGKTTKKFALYNNGSYDKSIWSGDEVFSKAFVTDGYSYELGSVKDAPTETTNQVGFKEASGVVTAADISADGYVQVPSASAYYRLADGTLVAGGSFVKVADKPQTAEVVSAPVVTFLTKDSDKDDVADAGAKTKVTDKDGFLKAVPEVSNDRFAGWFITDEGAKSIEDPSALTEGSVDGLGKGYWLDVDYLGSVKFTKDATFQAVFNLKAKTQKVEFDYGTWKGAPKTVKAKVKTNEKIDVNSIITEMPTRKGYAFLGWKAEGDTDAHYNANLTYVSELKDSNNDGVVTLTADWGKLGKDSAEKALKELVPVSNVPGFTASSEDKVNVYTKDSFKKYAAAWQSAYDQYTQAKWGKANGDVDAETAQDIIDTLTEAAKGLRYNTGVVDTTLDGKHDKGTNAIVYRLATLDGSRHFMTADENEVLVRTGKFSNGTQGEGGWKIESTSFAVAYRGGKDGNMDQAETGEVDLGYEVESVPGQGSVLSVTYKNVYRLYNPILQEHLYTSDENEVKDLTTKHGWVQDSSKATLKTPNYETDTKVVRFYNPSNGLHFYTTDKAEINFWNQHPGIWNNEGTQFYGL